MEVKSARACQKWACGETVARGAVCDRVSANCGFCVVLGILTEVTDGFLKTCPNIYGWLPAQHIGGTANRGLAALRVGPKAEWLLSEPMAISSQLVRPITMAPASSNRSRAVAVNCDSKPSSILEAPCTP